MVTITAPGDTAPSPPATAPTSRCEAFFAQGHEHATRLEPHDPVYVRLWDEMRSAAAGGKAVRPELLVRTYRALGGTDPALADHVAAAVELLHAAFVMHDDVIDHDSTRRGRLNVNGTFTHRARAQGASPATAANLGATAGILAGDLALVGAITTIARAPAPPHVTAALLDHVEEAVRTTAAGELADVELSLGVGQYTLDDVLTMAERKTAVYSFVLPMQAAALLVDSERATRSLPLLDRLGRHLGLAFQLQDDLLGLFGDPAHTGKSALTDLREGKLTPIITHARSTDAWPAVAPHHGNPDLTEEQAATARTEIEACGSRAFVESLAFDHLAAARALARAAALPAELIDWLTTAPLADADQARAA